MKNGSNCSLLFFQPGVLKWKQKQLIRVMDLCHTGELNHTENFEKLKRKAVVLFTLKIFVGTQFDLKSKNVSILNKFCSLV